MRRIVSMIPLALAALVVAGGAVATAAAPAPTSIVIRVKSVTTATIPTDKAPKGASKGDRVIMRDRLINVVRQFGKPAGAVVGRDEGVLTLTSATSGTFEGVATLPGGTIRLHGVVSNGVQTYTVVGGTLKYARARGTISVGPGKSPLNIYHLTLGSMTSVSPVI